MDHSMGFDTLNHDLLIAKLHIYDFSEVSPLLIKSYLTNEWQKTKVNTSFSTLTDARLRVCSWKLFFNMYIIDLFYFTVLTDVCMLKILIFAV